MAGGFLHILVQYYADSAPSRQAELDYCVRRNLKNPQVAAVHAFVEVGTPILFMALLMTSTAVLNEMPCAMLKETVAAANWPW